MEFIDYTGRGGIAPDAADDVGDLSAQQPQLQHFNHPPPVAMPEHTNPPYYNSNIPHPISCDIKPRLTKDQHDLLEAQYQKQPKPNTNTKKGFAETLNVSLDKVNNWFQNRRAKTKQDAKKQASAFNIYPPHQSLSDTETSPTFAPPSSEYLAMMQAWSADNQAPNGLGIVQAQQAQEQMQMRRPPMDHDVSTARQFHPYGMPQHLHPDAFDSDPELNRRTLTQEQFDAMGHAGAIPNDSGSFEPLQLGFQGDQEFMNQVFSEQVFTGLPDDFKQQDVWAFPHPVGAPLPSNDSTIPSSISEHSVQAFPPSTVMQNATGLSAPHSEWSDSRSSSLCSVQQDGGLIQHPMPASSQWQPGQSVPVDFNAMHEEFRQAAQAAHARDSPLQQSTQEQPLAWPADEAYVRRGSSASMLAHSMSNVELQTPQAPQPGTFKSPAPPSSIAARRQRKPAQLGLASLRSQSYSAAAGQPGSPGHGPQQAAFNATQTLRRIRSSNVIGSAPQGRVMKSLPGSAQRSPLSWTFADALNSPHAVRHPSAPQSQGNLAPPTPLSPSEFPRHDQTRPVPAWPSNGHIGQHPSISETDVEHGGVPFAQPAPVSTHNFSSPPHTPMYYQTHFMQQRIGSNVITENTPPQSAPASQTCFPANAFTVPQQPVHVPPQTQAPVQQSAMAMSQPQQYANVAVPDPRFQMPSVTYVPAQQAAAVASAPGVPVHFSNGVPMVDAEGNLQLAFPPQLQYVPQPAQTGTPPQAVYPFGTSAIDSPNMQVTAQPKQVASSELFVHEYSPPDSLKRSATVRKPVDSGPKNYTFANAGPEHFEAKAKKTESSVSSGSPASSIGAASAP